MDTNYNNETTEEEFGSIDTAAQSILERGSEVYGKAEQAVSDAYKKTSHKASETYDKANAYTHENPGKTILIALGVGIGLGLLLGAGSGRSRTSRIAKPVVKALSDIAKEYFH
ncbi:MAG: hypothetical protein ACYDHC_08960 [Desulfuromonadaceae bacterium]